MHALLCKEGTQALPLSSDAGTPENMKRSTELASVTYREVVAPPISNGILIPNLSISLATNIISSREGVMSPDRPMISIILKKEKKNKLEG